MLRFSACYARKVQYCNIACRARRKKRRKFSYFCPSPQSETWIDTPFMQCRTLDFRYSHVMIYTGNRKVRVLVCYYVRFRCLHPCIYPYIGVDIRPFHMIGFRRFSSISAIHGQSKQWKYNVHNGQK